MWLSEVVCAGDISIVGSGVGKTILSAAHVRRFLTLKNGAKLVLRALSVRHAKGSAITAEADSFLDTTDVEFKDNSEASAVTIGAMHLGRIGGGNFTFTSCYFSGNSATVRERSATPSKQSFLYPPRVRWRCTLTHAPCVASREHALPHSAAAQ
jgi:hypothetical protein